MRLRASISVLLLVVLALAAFIAVSTTPVGRLDERYPEDVYRLPRRLADTLQVDTLTILAYGNSQARYSIEHDLWSRGSWVTWKQFLFPFYQFYLMGRGVVGAWHYLRHDPDMGASGRRLVRGALAAAAEQMSPDFILHLGGMVADDGRRPEHWTRFLDENKRDVPLLIDYPMLPTPGNHEFTNDSSYGLPNYEAVFGFPRFYVVDTPHAAFFVLDSNVLIDHAGLLDDETQQAAFEKWFVSSDTTRPAWLERALAARHDRSFKLVAMHHPPVSFGAHRRDWHQPALGPALPERRRQLLDLFHRYGVQIVLSGHEHLYEHNLVRIDSAGSAYELHVVVSSGGGAPLRAAADDEALIERIGTYARQGITVSPLLHRSVHHFTRVRVTPDTLTLVTYAIRPDAPPTYDVIDRLALPAPRPGRDAGIRPAPPLAPRAGSPPRSQPPTG